MANKQFNKGLLDFLRQSPSPFHAVQTLSGMLDKAGFTRLDEADSWSLARQTGYYVVRNDSSIVAFKTGNKDLITSGVRIAGAHTDSPCLKIKPNPEVRKLGYVQLGVEVYGGALFNPWFDRDLSIAGRIHFRDEQGNIASALIDFGEPVAFIPSLAIHLDRTANEGRPVNAQKELPPLLLQCADAAAADKFSFDDLILAQLRKVPAGKNAASVLSHELFLYDTQPPAMVGLEQQFIASARLDNLLSCYASLQALLDSDDEQASVLVCNDHEEVGSASTSGAQGPFLRKVLERWIAGTDQATDAMDRVIHNSMLFSIDNAHGVHPNYMDKHDDQHRPILNRGPVIKINANQRYASNSASIALFKALCEQHKVPYQSFVMRSDMACGSTIGPITATELGVTTLDIGVPTFGMHSCRELAGADDAADLTRLVTAFYSRHST